MTDYPTHLNTDAAAEYLGMSPRTLERWRLTNQGPPWRAIGRAVRYARTSLEEWARAQTVTPEADEK